MSKVKDVHILCLKFICGIIIPGDMHKNVCHNIYNSKNKANQPKSFLMKIFKMFNV